MHTLVAGAANVARKLLAEVVTLWSGPRKSACELVVQTGYSCGGDQGASNETGLSFGDAVHWPWRVGESSVVPWFSGTGRCQLVERTQKKCVRIGCADWFSAKNAPRRGERNRPELSGGRTLAVACCEK